MSRRSGRKRSVSDENSLEEVATSQSSRRRCDSEEGEELEEIGTELGFSQQAPEASQGILPERRNERVNLEHMDRAKREKAVTSLSRLVLFKALSGEPIDRLKVLKEAGIAGERIGSAAFQEVAARLRKVFGFELSRIPKYMEDIKGLPNKYKDRHYVLNGIIESNDGLHSKSIHSQHQDSAIEKGLLMLVLAIIFCKGESRADGSRWILSRDLYRLLNKVDDSIPGDPPTQGTSRAKAGSQNSQRSQSRFKENGSLTPNVDFLLERFVSLDYLWKEKATDENFSSQTPEEGDVIYTMGPRAAMEVGRKQIIYFCAEILDEEPDPTMLKEVEEELDVDEDEEDYPEPTPS